MEESQKCLREGEAWLVEQNLSSKEKVKKKQLLTIPHIPGHTSDLQLESTPGQKTRKVDEACQSRDLG